MATTISHNVNPIVKFRAFSWNVIALSTDTIMMLSGCHYSKKQGRRQRIAETVKGKGVAFMENQIWLAQQSSNPEQCAGIKRTGRRRRGQLLLIAAYGNILGQSTMKIKSSGKPDLGAATKSDANFRASLSDGNTTWAFRTRSVGTAAGAAAAGRIPIASFTFAYALLQVGAFEIIHQFYPRPEYLKSVCTAPCQAYRREDVTHQAIEEYFCLMRYPASLTVFINQ